MPPLKAQSEPGAAVSGSTWDELWGDYASATQRNPAQAYRRRLVFDALALARAPAPVRLLDLGSGIGDLALDVSRARPDAEIVGLELSAGGVAIAAKKVPGARFFQQDFTRTILLEPRYLGWATHAVCSEVLEHLDDPVAMLKNVRPLLSPGCRVAVTVPAGPMSAFDRHLGHRRHFDRARLRATLLEAGLDVDSLRGAGFPFYNLYRLVVVARGERLIGDLVGDDSRELPLSARAAMQLFSWLFRYNASKAGPGWQLVAVAAEPR
jgi:SAM-dependent methyltransferase